MKTIQYLPVLQIDFVVLVTGKYTVKSVKPTGKHVGGRAFLIRSAENNNELLVL